MYCYTIFATFSFVCSFGVWDFVFVCFLFDGEVENFVLYQAMVDMTAEQPLNGILAIRRTTRSTLFRTEVLSDALHPSVESKQSGWKTSVTEFL